MILPVILAGGTGTRLWPLSRELYPKQLISLIGEKTMLQETALRLEGLEGLGQPIVVCNENHRFMVAEQLRAVGFDSASILLEPAGRNTAPAIAAAAIRALDIEEDPLLLVLPADHFIRDVPAFHQALNEGMNSAASGLLITFGIVPDGPETGYGYIRKGRPLGNSANGAFAIAQFVEKPPKDKAEEYVRSGEYCWNSGMFMFKARRVMEELRKHAPGIVQSCEAAVRKGRADFDFFRLDREAFCACPGEPIDIAVMEKTENGAMIPLQAGWNDLGSWEALWQVGEKDGSQNVLQGDVLVHDVKTSFLHATGRIIAAVGLENHIVVETADAVLISPRNRVQEVKLLVEKLKANRREEVSVHKKVYRPWGSYESIDAAERFEVKRVTLKPGAKISLQKHHHRAEHWIVVRGTALVTRGEETFLLKEDESTYIPLGVTHRLENPGIIPLDLIEVRTGTYLGENDVHRFKDDYGR